MDFEPVGLAQLIALGFLEVGLDHGFHQFREAHLRFPAEDIFRLGRVAEQKFYFSGPEVARVNAHQHLPGAGVPAHFIDAGSAPFQRVVQFLKGPFDEFAHGAGFPGGDHIVVGGVLLQHQPHRADKIPGVAPIAFRVEVPQIQSLLCAEVDAGDGAGDLAGDEGFAAQGRFMVEQNAVAGVHSVGFAVVDGDPVAVDLGRAVGAARVEGGGFLLRNFPDLTEHFTGGGLVETGFLFQAENADAFQNAQGTEGVGIGGVFGRFEGDGDVALRGEVIEFVGLNLLQDADQAGGVGQVAMMEDEPAVGLVRVLVEMVDPLGVEQGGAAFNAVDGVAFVQQEFGEIRAVLAGDAGDQCGFAHSTFPFKSGKKELGCFRQVFPGQRTESADLIGAQRLIILPGLAQDMAQGAVADAA
jgi:hypothetical protein